MADSRVFFSHTVAAMFLEAFPPTAVPGLLERYRGLGLDLSKPLLPGYEYGIWRACLAAQRELALPGKSLEEASYAQGAAYVNAYLDRTPLGGALLLLLRAIGPRRTLDRMSRNFRSGNNFSQVTFKPLDGSVAELEVNDVFSESPEYIRGLLIAGLARTGATMTVETLRHAGDAATFRATWA